MYGFVPGLQSCSRSCTRFLGEIVFRLARCALNWVLWVPRESVLLCAPVWDLLWHKAVSKSEKADLQVFITCAGCLPLRIGSRMSEHRGREVSKLKGP